MLGMTESLSKSSCCCSIPETILDNVLRCFIFTQIRIINNDSESLLQCLFLKQGKMRVRIAEFIFFLFCRTVAQVDTLFQRFHCAKQTDAVNFYFVLNAEFFKTFKMKSNLMAMGNDQNIPTVGEMMCGNHFNLLKNRIQIRSLIPVERSRVCIPVCIHQSGRNTLTG